VRLRLRLGCLGPPVLHLLLLLRWGGGCSGGLIQLHGLLLALLCHVRQQGGRCGGWRSCRGRTGGTAKQGQARGKRRTRRKVKPIRVLNQSRVCVGSENNNNKNNSAQALFRGGVGLVGWVAWATQ
jgi:hypothetical protein